jgi:transcriptional regulator with XRE-family HTH domain
MSRRPDDPMRQAFAAALKAAMARQGLTASQLARLVWGTIKDNRGYDVSRGRDRIGHYLRGTSYPDPANLIRLAAALGVPAATLVPPIVPTGSRGSGAPGGGGAAAPVIPGIPAAAWGAALQWIEDHPWMVAGLDEERRRYLPFALAALWQAGRLGPPEGEDS